MKIPRVITPERQQRSDPAGRWVGIAGGAVLVASAFLPWAYSFAALDGMTLVGYPSPLQYCGMVLGLLVAGLIVCSRLIKPRGKIRVGWVRGAKAAATGALVYIAIIILSIAVELGGLINVVYGGWLALLGAALAFAGTRLMIMDKPATLSHAQPIQIKCPGPRFQIAPPCRANLCHRRVPPARIRLRNHFLNRRQGIAVGPLQAQSLGQSQHGIGHGNRRFRL